MNFRQGRLRLVKLSFIVVVTFLLVTLFNLYFIRPVRNFILRPVLPHVWRTVDTADILMMRKVKLPTNVTDPVACGKNKHVPRTKFANVNQKKMIKYNVASPANPFFQKEQYAGFLPGISDTERVDTLLLYQVFAETMKRIGAEFFFVGGSLLGVLRHGGSIPWDTDIDLALNGSDWKIVRDALSCLEGYHLTPKWHMHWKFGYQGRYFPFIDLFFYTENDRYLWALNYYTLNNVLYEKKYVTPLKTALYEGILVPVPNNMEYIVRIEFDIEYCYPPDTNHRNGLHYKKTVVLCSTMSTVYPMQNLKF